MPRRVFVTGATGFVGMAVLETLLDFDRDFEVNALVRPDHVAKLGPLADRVRVIRGDLFDAGALDAGMSGVDAVIHLVGIIFEDRSKNVTFERMHVRGTRSVLEAIERNQVRRYVHMSALGARPNAVSTYHQTKYAAEELVRGTRGLDWTILRPSMIHGPRGDFTRMAADWAKRKAVPYLFMPYFGRGLLGFSRAGKLQPVYVGEVARAFADALEKRRTVRGTYDVVGPDVLTWPQLLHAIARAVVGRRRLALPIPAWYAKLLTRVAPAPLLPFNRDQVVMSQEDNTADPAPFAADFGWAPAPFALTLATYAGELKGDATRDACWG
jgi:uncharacterized protein YbjT (DUF2867 family)